MEKLNKKKLRRLAIIPARLGSKRIKKKYKIIFGKPIISYPIKQLKLSRLFDKIFVSTEDKALKKIAESYGAKVDFLRSKKLSKDKTPLILVLKNVISELKKEVKFMMKFG